MLLREHPKLAPWPPIPDSIACVGPTPPKPEEIPGLKLKNFLASSPLRIVFYLNYEGGDCLMRRNFEDKDFFIDIQETLRNSLGQTLKQIGDINVNF
jgi:hypothetical protein